MENNKKQGLNTPTAIIVAGFLVMIAIFITGGIGNKGSDGAKTTKNKTLSEQVGVNKAKFDECLKGTDIEALRTLTNASAEKAMKGIPPEQRGTPYSVIVGRNGIKTDIRGAYPKENVQKLIDEVVLGKVTVPYTGEVPAYTTGEHIVGNPDAQVMIIEYSDLECSYCKRFHDTMKSVVAESNGNVAWVYRHWIVRGPTSMQKAAASECVAKLKGEDAFWKYIDLVFGLMQTEAPAPKIDNL